MEPLSRVMGPLGFRRRHRALVVAALVASVPASAQDLAGSWSGWARLTNDWPGLSCVYDGSATPGSVKLELAHTGDKLGGTIVIVIPAAAGSECPPLRKQYLVTEGRLSEAALAFTDSGSNEWNLGTRQEGGVLKGLVAWKGGGTPEALAAGFAVAGVTPLARLSGEVRLERPGGATGAAAGGGGASLHKVTGGERAGHIAAIIGANVVAAAALVAVNKLGKSSTSGSLTCSPRNCFLGSPGEPCLCNANVLAGASCGTTPSGVPLGGACNGTTLPCQSGFSCNGGICQDGSGACPY